MRLRTSLHRLFESEGTTYAYVTGSGAIFRLDETSRRILDDFDASEGTETSSWAAAQGDASDLAERRDTLDQLVLMGLIRPVGELAPPQAKLPPMPFPLATLVLNVTNRCNLSCTYCYEYGEDRLVDAGAAGRAPMMSPDVARQSVDFLFASAAGRKALNVTFFGGETLLNLDAIREAVRHGESRAASEGRAIAFSLTTNATLLDDDVIRFLTSHRFGINISIDGAREDHDRHRVFRSGRGSYAMIVPRIKQLIEANQPNGRPIGARVTLTKGTTNLRGLYAHLVDDIGFDQVGFAPVTSAPGRDYALLEHDLDHILREFSVLAADYAAAALENRPHGFSNMDDLLRELHQGVNKAHPCGAGLGLLGVSTEGDLGLCHRFVESGEHEVGSVTAGLDEPRREAFLEKGHVANKPECHDCFARPHCSGGCYHEAHVRYQDSSKPNLHYCEWIRAWTDLGLQTYGRIMNGNPDFFTRFDDAIQPSERSEEVHGLTEEV